MAPAITLLPRSRSPKTSPLCVCHPTLLNSIRSKTSGNICAATNSRSPSSTTTTTSSIKPATHGTSLNKIQSASRQSPHEHGKQSIIRAVGIRSAPALQVTRSLSLTQHLVPDLFHGFEALPGFVRERHDSVAARLVMRD